MTAGLLVMSPLLLAELDHVATRELGSEAALGAVDDLRRWMSRGRVVIPEITEHHLGAAQAVRVRYRALGRCTYAQAGSLMPCRWANGTKSTSRIVLGLR